MKKRGQSLVEYALTLPILLLLVAGMTEVGHFILVYNRMEALVREGARFGAAGGSDIVGIMEQNSVTAEGELVEISEDATRIWVVRPVIDTTTNPWSWQGASAGNPWGVGHGCDFPETCTADIPISASEAIDNIENNVDFASDSDAAASLNGTTFVVVALEYEAPSILNITYFDLGADGTLPLRTFAIFKQEVEQQTVNRLASGCSAYPIAVNEALIPANPTEGDLFQELRLNDHAGSPPALNRVAFLAWRGSLRTVNDLDDALDFPGNSLDATVGYQSPDDGTDTSLHRGDVVLNSENQDVDATGNLTAVLDEHVNRERALRIITYRFEGSASPNPSARAPRLYGYEIANFIVVRINDYSPANNSITLEYVRADASCGFED